MDNPLDAILLAMVELKSIQNDFVVTYKEVVELERELQKKKSMYTALHQLVRAMGGDPAKAILDAENAEEAEADKAPQTLPLGLAFTLPDVVKEAMPPAGHRFIIDDIFPSVLKRFPTVKRGDIANILWRFAKHGELETVQKGKRGNPAKYLRN